MNDVATWYRDDAKITCKSFKLLGIYPPGKAGNRDDAKTICKL